MIRKINNIDANEIKKSLINVDVIRAIGKRYNKKLSNLSRLFKLINWGIFYSIFLFLFL